MNEDFTTLGGWCDADGDTFLVGDTNGDHHDDWICHHRDGTVCIKYNSFIFGGKFHKSTTHWLNSIDIFLAYSSLNLEIVQN